MHTFWGSVVGVSRHSHGLMWVREILRYHRNVNYLYQKQKYLDVADCYNNILMRKTSE
jgi:hypothetical protein